MSIDSIIIVNLIVKIIVNNTFFTGNIVYNESMEENVTCPTCHTTVRITDYFCFNCGANLHPKPVSLSAVNLIPLFLGTVLLPPMGIVWGIRYIREKSSASKVVGFLAIIITIIILIIGVQVIINVINTVNNQVNSQIQNIQGL